MADSSSAPHGASVPPLQPGFLPNIKFDVTAGFLVFLIAMPLCLGIATASQYQPIAGIWTAVIGGILTTFLSNSQLTIKGPAAGLIVVVATSVISLGEYAVPALSDADTARVTALATEKGGDAQAVKDALAKELQSQRIAAGYPLALGCAFIAGILQFLSGLFKAGTLGELVPLTPVHGMLASIGITIMAKQLFPMLGLKNPDPSLSPMEVILAIPSALPNIHWTIAAVGLVSLAILIAFPYLKAKLKFLGPVPAQVIVLAVAIPMALALGFDQIGKDTGLKTLVTVPNILANPKVELPKAFTFPNFSAVLSEPGLEAILLFWLIASIESLLSAQAIDMIDPWKRKTNMNRDLMACGAANALCASVGALPMISEIVRSRANIDNGARTRYANMFHGLFLLAFVLVLPTVINIIPMAALGAMLVFVGFRLASPREFFATYRIGKEQLFIFILTIVVTLSTDLLIGVLSGIAVKFMFHMANGAPVGTMLKPKAVLDPIPEDANCAVVHVHKSAVFSNWLGVRGAILKASQSSPNVVVDLSDTKLVDHSVMEKLHELEKEFETSGKHLTIVGLDLHTPMSAHPYAARKRRS